MKNPHQSPIFSEQVAFLKASQFWSRDELEKLQAKKLRNLIRHAYKHVPYYRELMASRKLMVEDFQCVGDIKLIPTITKKLIQENHEKFIATNFKRTELLHRTTGGSTGTPLTIYMDFDSLARDRANTEHYMNVFGLDIFNYKSVRLYGDRIDPQLIDKGIYWKIAEDRKLIMSCYHIDKQTAPKYVRRIEEFEPRYIHTRPSSILPLAKYIETKGLGLRVDIPYIFCDGEYLTEGQRKMIESAFSCSLVNIYGHTEASAAGHPCQHSPHLHFMPQVGITEVLDSHGNDVEESGKIGELVVTGFNNYAFPMIRYRTGDRAIVGTQECPCGRKYKIIEQIEGRMQDYVVSRDNVLIPLAPAVFNYNDMDWKGVREFKVYQHKIGELTIRIMPEEELLSDPEYHQKRICRKISDIFCGAFKIKVEFVDNIPKSTIGKHRYLEQNLDITSLF